MANNEKIGDIVGKVHCELRRAGDEYVDRKIYDLFVQNPGVKYKNQGEIAKAIGVTQSGVSKSWRRLKVKKFIINNKRFVFTNIDGNYSMIEEQEMTEPIVMTLAKKDPFAEYRSVRVSSNMIGYSLKPDMTKYLEEILREHFAGLSIFDILINDDKLYVILYDHIAKTTRSFFEDLPKLVESKIK